jgi:MscS family membrane protein
MHMLHVCLASEPASDVWAQENWLLAAIFFGVAVVTFVFRRFVARGLLCLVLTRTRRRSKTTYAEVRDVLMSPTGLLLPGLFFVLALRYAQFIPEAWQDILVKIGETLFTAAAFWLLYRLAMVFGVLIVERKTSAEGEAEASAATFLVNMLRFFIVVIGIFVLLSLWVKNVAGLITGLGIGGLALSLAAQDTIGNFIGSLAIMMDHPFVVGDWIVTSDLEGTVESIGLRTSKVRTFDGGRVSVPNKTLAQSVIKNESRREKRRIELRLTVPWDIPRERCEAFLEAMRERIERQPGVIAPPLVVLRDLTTDGMGLYARIFVGPDFDDMLRVQDRLNRDMMEIARELDVSIAAPRRIAVAEATDAVRAAAPSPETRP